MTAEERYLAIDLGAESGRAVAGSFDGDRLSVEEVHRFPNRPVRLPSGLHWDILSLLAEVRSSIAAATRDGNITSVGIDTWGVDFGLLDARGALLANPFHYRDSRTDGMLEAAFELVPRAEIFAQTGIQFMQINSLYQLLAMVRADDPLLRVASTFLTVPDLLNYWLTGEQASEFTIATTTQCLDPRTRTWADPLLERLGIPLRLFREVRPPGSVLGRLLEEPHAPVVLVGAHDTASAVAGTPLRGPDAAYISSGTWSLVGVEVREPVINARTLALNMTNEGGVANTFRLLRNVMGLWLVQGIRRSVSPSVSYEDLVTAAAASPPLQVTIDPDAGAFLRAEDMAHEIRAFCAATGQRPPETTGAVVRAALEGLALRYRWVIDRLEEVTGQTVRVIHVVGGGARNRLLCQMTADATRRLVLAGPVEATALGNVAVQAIASGRLASLEQAREVIARSFAVEQFSPAPSADWDAAYARFCSMVDGPVAAEVA